MLKAKYKENSNKTEIVQWSQCVHNTPSTHKTVVLSKRLSVFINLLWFYVLFEAHGENGKEKRN